MLQIFHRETRVRCKSESRVVKVNRLTCRSAESASRPLIILMIMTITIWVFDVFNEM
jgi:hypothetical protein